MSDHDSTEVDAGQHQAPSEAAIIAAAESGKLLATIFDGRWLYGDQRNVLAQQLVALHNADQIDLLALPLDQLAGLDTQLYFAGHSLFYEMIPQLVGEVGPMMRLVNALVARAGNDMASNLPNAAYQAWAQAEPFRALAGLELEATGDPAAAKLLRCNLVAGGFVDRAIALIAQEDQERRLPAIFALGQMPLNKAQASAAHTAMVRALHAYPDDLMAANTLAAAIAIAARQDRLDAPELLALAKTALALAGPQVHYAIGHILLNHRERLPASLVADILGTLGSIDLSQNSAFSLLDGALAGLLDGAHAPLAIDALARLFSQPGGEAMIALLKGTGYKLGHLPPQTLSKVIVQWLLAPRHRLREALNTILTAADQKGAIAFSLADVDLPPREQYLLCRRACGYFFLKPQLAASVLLGVLREGHPEVRAAVADLLYDPLAINYGGLERDYLDAIGPEDPAHAIVGQVLARLETFRKGLGEIAFLKELQPSGPRRQMEHERHARVMREAYKAAEKESPILSLVSRSTLLHGRGSLSYFRGPNEKVDHSSVMELKTHSYAWELPRVEVLDPVGLAMQLRALKFGEPVQ
jgi:hypothetical protein